MLVNKGCSKQCKAVLHINIVLTKKNVSHFTDFQKHSVYDIDDMSNIVKRFYLIYHIIMKDWF